MRNTLLVTVAILGLASGPLLAQPATPGGSTAGVPGTAGVGSPAGSPAPDSMPGGMNGMRPMRGQTRLPAGTRAAAPAAMKGKPTRGATGHAAPASMAQDRGVAVPGTGDYRGGAGSPFSANASNITGQDTRSEMAPRLPDPAAANNSPQAYLAAAQRALASNRTGAAQEALERAETRLLSRSTDPSMAGTPDPAPMVQQIGAARRALAARDMAGARSAISAAMAGS